jgi:hypothetical protein
MQIRFLRDSIWNSGQQAVVVPAYSAGPTLRICTVFPFHHRALQAAAPGRYVCTTLAMIPKSDAKVNGCCRIPNMGNDDVAKMLYGVLLNSFY